MNNNRTNDQAHKPDAGSAAPQHESPQALRGEARPADPVDADDVLTRKLPVADQAADAAVLAASRQHTRRAFALGGLAAAAGYGFYHWLGQQPSDLGVPRLLRRSYRFNAQLSRSLFHDHALAPTYPVARAETLRVNGVYGLKMALKPDTFRLQLVGAKDAAQHPSYVPDVTAWEYGYEADPSDQDQGHDTKVDPKIESAAKMASADKMAQAQADERHTGRTPRGFEEAGESYSTLRPNTPGLLLRVQDFLPQLPRHELVTQFKCIEGWSQIVHWAGVRMADFLDLYPPAPIKGRDPRYVYMETPDGDYYVGYDMHVCRHPQSLLVTEMITKFHGAPLRMHMPTKYGYKQIKRIGLIAYTDDRPDDYWTKLGYDWYAGL